jgi:hypothetical protein
MVGAVREGDCGWVEVMPFPTFRVDDRAAQPQFRRPACPCPDLRYGAGASESASRRRLEAS